MKKISVSENLLHTTLDEDILRERYFQYWAQQQVSKIFHWLCLYLAVSFSLLETK